MPILFLPYLLPLAAVLAFTIAMWRRWWFLALAGVLLAGAFPVLYMQLFSPISLAVYFIAMLSVLLVGAYGARWPDLALVGFGICVLYHPVIFSVVSLSTKQGAFLLEHAFWFLGALLVLYTIVPWLYAGMRPSDRMRYRIVDILLPTLVGGYVFATFRALIHNQLRLVEQLKFIRLFVQAPHYHDLLLWLFVWFGLFYLSLYACGLLCRRKNIVQDTLLILGLLSFMGAGGVLSRGQSLHRVCLQYAQGVQKKRGA